MVESASIKWLVPDRPNRNLRNHNKRLTQILVTHIKSIFAKVLVGFRVAWLIASRLIPAGAEVRAHVSELLPEGEDLLQVGGELEQFVVEGDHVDDRLAFDLVQELLGLPTDPVPTKVPTDDHLGGDDGDVAVALAFVAVILLCVRTHLRKISEDMLMDIYFIANIRKELKKRLIFFKCLGLNRQN